ncbi:MAG: multicopper oxidase family protein [Paracoccaceae bacterium]
MTDPLRRPTRRTLLAGAASAALLPAARAFAQDPASGGSAAPAERLVAGPTSVRLVPEGHPETAVWAYDGAVPGPVIRIRRGERLRRELVNRLDQPTTVHWHGIRLPNAMDGVPGISQPPVAPGGRFLYDFVAPDPGTYWYHPHVRSWEQVARGLAGARIVEEDEAPSVDRDEVLVLDDWRLTETAAIAEGFESLHDRAHAGRIGNWITVNGEGEPRLPVRPHERLRLRLINAATARVFRLGVQGLAGRIAALDGHALAGPATFETLTLAPAQRADLIVDVTAEAGGEALLVSFERDGGFALVSLSVEGEARRVPLAAPAPLEPGTVPPLGDLAAARRARLVMEGGAMGGLASARLGDETLTLRDLAGRGRAWAFNGRADPPETPLLEAGLGETVRIALVNRSRWAHAMHLHGHHFREIGADDAIGPLRDTLLIAPNAETEIAFVADNPGDWLLHCHMLAHAASGMSTWLRVAV